MADRLPGLSCCFRGESKDELSAYGESCVLGVPNTFADLLNGLPLLDQRHDPLGSGFEPDQDERKARLPHAPQQERIHGIPPAVKADKKI